MFLILKIQFKHVNSKLNKVMLVLYGFFGLQVREVPLVLQGRWVPRETLEYKEKREIPEVKEHLE